MMDNLHNFAQLVQNIGNLKGKIYSKSLQHIKQRQYFIEMRFTGTLDYRTESQEKEQDYRNYVIVSLE